MAATAREDAEDAYELTADEIYAESPNPYVRQPLHVTLWSLLAGAPGRTYVFLTGAPRAVVRAANRAEWGDKAKTKLRWKRADAKTLKGFYGAGWADALTPRGSGTTSVRGGYDDADDFDFSIFDAFDALGEEGVGAAAVAAEVAAEVAAAEPAEPAAARSLRARPPAAPVGKPGNGPGADMATPAYVQLGVYPEDMWEDLAALVNAAVGVPLGRQHLFALGGEGGGGSSGGSSSSGNSGNSSASSDEYFPGFELELDGDPLSADVREIPTGTKRRWDVKRASREFGLGRPAAEAGGVPVAPELYSRRAGLYVTDRTRERWLDGTRQLYLADLAEVFAAAPRAALAQAVGDRYLSALLHGGLVARYWPAMTEPAMASLARGRLPDEFPALAPRPAESRAAREALDRLAASAWKASCADRQRGKKKGRRGAAPGRGATPIRVQAAEVQGRVEGGPDLAPGAQLVNVRAVLEAWRATPATPLVFGEYPPAGQGDAAGLGGVPAAGASGAPESTANSSRLVRVVKRHRAGASLVDARAAAAFLGRDFGGGERNRSGRRRVPFAAAATRVGPFLWEIAVWADGEYRMRGRWGGKARAGGGDSRRLGAPAPPPEVAAAELAAAAAALVAAANSAGDAAFPLGGRLGPASAIRDLTGSFDVPATLSARGVRIARESFPSEVPPDVARVRAGGGANSTASPDARAGDPLEFVWRRGRRTGPGLLRAEARRRLARRLEDAGGIVKPNGDLARHGDVAAAAAYAEAAAAGGRGRVVFLGAAVRVELSGVTAAEFGVARRLLRGYARKLAADRSLALRAGERRARKGRGSRGRLEALKEADPVLFDFARGKGPGGGLYSTICQGAKQPAIFGPGEVAAMGARRRAALTPYWNFTRDEPAFYGCPDPRYPHLGLSPGSGPRRHPRGVCLPCCRATPGPPGSRAAAADAACAEAAAAAAAAAAAGEGGSALAAYAAPDIAAAGDPRHPLAYPKPIPPGRIGRAPPLLESALLLGAVREVGAGLPKARRPELRLAGVEPLEAGGDARAARASAAPALAAVLGLTVGELAAALADWCAGNPLTLTLAGGRAARLFPDTQAAADSLRALGAGNRLPPTPDPRGFDDFLVELFAFVYRLPVVRFRAAGPGRGAGPDSFSDLTFEVADSAAGWISGAAASLALVVTHPGGTYPLFLMEPTEFLRGLNSSGEGPALRFYGPGAGAPVAAAVARMVSGGKSKPKPKPKPRAKAKAKTAAGVPQLGSRGLVCGVIYGLSDDPRDDICVLPVKYRPMTNDELETGFYFVQTLGPDLQPRRSPEKLAEVLARERPEVTAARSLRTPEGALVGFVGSDNLSYLHREVALGDGAGSAFFWAGAEPSEVPYPHEEVDSALISARGRPGGHPVLGGLAAAADAELIKRRAVHRVFAAVAAEVAAELAAAGAGASASPVPADVAERARAKVVAKAKAAASDSAVAVAGPPGAPFSSEDSLAGIPAELVAEYAAVAAELARTKGPPPLGGSFPEPADGAGVTRRPGVDVTVATVSTSG